MALAMELPSPAALYKKMYGTDDPHEVYELLFEETKELSQELWDTPLEMYSKMKLPYYAPTHLVPQPLPTVQDIERAKPRGNMAPRALATPDIYQVNDVFIVKFSKAPALIREAENMLFLEQQQPQLQMPKLYAAFSHQGANPLGLDMKQSDLPTYYYVIMEYIQGVSMHVTDWEDNTTLEFQDGIVEKIAQQVQLLRSIPAPEPNCYGRIHQQPWHSFFCAFRTQKKEPSGPYYSKEEFIEALSESVLHKTLISGAPKEDWSPCFSLGLRYFRSTLSKFEGWEPKMTHLNLKIDNIILRPINPEVRQWWKWWETPLQELKAEDYEVVLINWTEACWMPAWVEIANMTRRSPKFRRRWMSVMSKGLEPFYFMEYSLYETLTQYVVLKIF